MAYFGIKMLRLVTMKLSGKFASRIVQVRRMKVPKQANQIRGFPSKQFLCLILGSALLSVGWFGKMGLRPRYLNGVDEEGAKVYAGKVPIYDTYAYHQFELGPKTESGKLSYFLSRFSEMKNCYFRFLGNRYGFQDAYFGANWLITRRYNGNQDARIFLREQITLFEKPSAPLLIEFPDGSLHRVLPIVTNELDLLEETIRKEKTQTLPPFQDLPA